MTVSRLAASALVSASLVALAAWHFDWSLEKAALLAPVIVLSAGAAAFLVVLWAKVVRDSLRGR